MTTLELLPPTLEPDWSAPTGAPAGLEATPLPGSTPMVRRSLRHRRMMHYNRLIAGVLAANALAFGYALAVGALWSASGPNLALIAFVAQANLLLAVLPRQQWAINVLGWLATRPSHRWPLRMRWALGKYYHLGGVHVGAALAGTGWYLFFVGSLLITGLRGSGDVSRANLVVSTCVVLLFISMIVTAMPGRRSANHDRFEKTHRFCAWGSLALVWVNTMLFALDRRGDETIVAALAGTPAVWLLLLSTALAAWPWMLLRRVPITVERPSSHVAIVRLDHGVVPAIGTTRPISRHPLVGWHQFANVPAAAGESGYRMVVSRAGDWTGEFINDPPAHVWVRGLPSVGVANVKRLFHHVVFVVTGSGIGPALGHLLSSETPSKLVWITRSPRATYGDDLVDAIERAHPDAIIWNSDEHGKPDVLRLAYGAYVDSGAEAVICISNKLITWQVVEGLEQRGIPAFGPIWDS
ncbi:MAG: hypothetical protein ABWZ99_19295 [Ilumatobacteraceae bacterium]